MERRLAAILVADVVAFSRLVGEDEEGTLARLRATRMEVFEPRLARHHGRMVKLMGDGALVEFASVVDAVTCAVDIQQAMTQRAAGQAERDRILYRIGINVGDVVVEGDDILGDGVNIAARLEGLAEPGGISVSGKVYDEVRGKVDFAFDDLGKQRMKNIEEPIRVYAIRAGAPDGARTGAGGAGYAAPAWRKLPALPLVAAAAAVILIAIGLTVWLRPWEAGVAPVATPAQLPALSDDRPSLAVLPFDNLSGDPEQEYFVDGMTEDLITDLSQVSGLLVIARNSVFTYKGRAVNVQQIGRELGVKYVLEGSVRRAGNRIRINAQLVRTVDGTHVWAERFDREITDVFALQDAITRKLVTALAITLTQGEEQRLNRGGEVSPEAYDMLLRGLERLRRFTPEDNRLSRDFFERALALDPNFARAHADLAFSYSMELLSGWTASPEESALLAKKHAKDALELDPDLREVHFAMGSVYLRERRFEEALEACLRAIKIDPNYADAYAQMAWFQMYAGRAGDGLELIEQAMRLNPHYPFFYSSVLGQIYFHLKRFPEAAEAFEVAVDRNPQFSIGRQLLATTYAHLGRIEDAEWEAGELLTLLPDFTVSAERARSPYKRQEDLDLYIDGLRKAGLPE
ncbi:MAG: tetratricopeptide repeat protein [Proteobacteria bacterium]|nr:tetratricopeptide repeat protein [Pseudomonadota bacterium]